MNLILSFRRLIYLLFWFLDRIISIKRRQIIIFCYHSIDRDKWRFSIKPDNFIKQLDFLIQHYNPVTLEQIEQHLDGKLVLPDKSFVITIDDGYKNILAIKKNLKNLGIKPTLFILSDSLNANTGELGVDKQLLQKEEILSLINDGWIIGSHSATHSDFNNLDETQIIREIKDSKSNLEKELGIKIKYFSYPKGRYSKKIIKAVKEAGYSLSVSMDDGFINASSDRFSIPRVGVDKTHKLWEFPMIFSPSVVLVRGILKKVNLERLVV